MTAPAPSFIRRSQRVIRMVSELHRLGYQRLRIMPYEYPLAWRLMVAPASVFSCRNGAFVPERLRRGAHVELTIFDGFYPTYSSASENEYFGWADARQDDAFALAERFRARFAEVAAAGRGRDWAYAGWLADLVGHLASRPVLPFVFGESLAEPAEALRGLPVRDFETHAIRLEDFPLPPPGEAADA